MVKIGSVARWLLRNAVVVGVVVLAAAAGYGLRAGCAELPQAPGPGEIRAAEAAPAFWTCSMHPQIRESRPGRCRICGMELIPVSAGAGDEAGPREFQTGEAALKLMEIETSPVERRFVTAPVRMAGKLAYDETRLGYITAWLPGRLDRLFVDYTGIRVDEGDQMAELYSPDLLAAQEELLQALRAVEELKASNVDVIKETAHRTVDAAREKLRLWGLTAEQVREIEGRGRTTDRMVIHAPMGGTVVHKNAQEGMYVRTGTRLYTIADLSHLWVELDAYESDLIWLRYGQEVEITTEAYPGEVFQGWVAFIAPVVNERTRTVKVRVNLPNPDGKLKPEMFVRAVVRATVAQGGRVIEPRLLGKWVCPTHPDVVKDRPGDCDLCGKALVRPESLGYVAADEAEAARPLVIPVSAALVTGTRAVVYVRAPDAARPTFEGREVVLGPRAGDYYLVRHGLSEGELVVTRGNFKIDSALQILAKPSMMAPEGGGGGAGHRHGGGPAPAARAAERAPTASVPPGGAAPARAPAPAVAPQEGDARIPQAFSQQLGRLLEAYLAVQTALAEDDGDAAAQSAGAARGALAQVDMGLLPHDVHMAWMAALPGIQKAFDDLASAADIEAMRAEFEPASEALASALRRFGAEVAELVYVMRCPMAFGGKGAIWLQSDEDVRNPYFGAAMLDCGDVTGTIPTGGASGGHVHD